MLERKEEKKQTERDREINYEVKRFMQGGLHIKNTE